MSSLPGFLTCLLFLLATNHIQNSESARRKMSPKCEAAWNECSLLTTDAIENFLMNKICENVKKSLECYTKHGCPEGEPHLKSLHRACGSIKEPMIKAQKIPPGETIDNQQRKKSSGKSSTKKKKKNENQIKSAKKIEKSSTKTKKSSTKIKSEL